MGAYQTARTAPRRPEAGSARRGGGVEIAWGSLPGGIRGARFALVPLTTIREKGSPMTEHELTPSEEPTAPLPPIPSDAAEQVTEPWAAPHAEQPAPATYAEAPASPGVTPAATPAPVHPHHKLSTGATFACIAAGAVALLFAFVAGWAAHGIESRMASRSFGPGGRGFAHAQFDGRFAERSGGRCPGIGQRGDGSNGYGPMTQRGWPQQSPDTTPQDGSGGY